MFSRLFKKKSTTPEVASSPAATPLATAAASPDWPAQLAAARGHDDALLAISRSIAPHAIRLAAVQALAGTAALHVAEQAFHNRDKTLHRAAQQKLDTQARQQATQATAHRLLETARQWVQDAKTASESESEAKVHPLPAANHLVELDQAWRALDDSLLDDTQRSEFALHQQTLSRLMREHAEQQRDKQRQQAALAVAQSEQEAAARATAAATHLEEQQLELALQNTDQQAQATARQQAQQIRKQLEGTLNALEAALLSGQLAETPAQLALLRELTARMKAAAAESPLHQRIQAIEGEYARLKGWQHWGGEQARLNLVEAAEQLVEQLTATRHTPASIKQHTQAIEQLRARWKVLDATTHGAQSGLWKRFDAALTLAWQPVAEQRQQLATAREQNLQARQNLLSELEACPRPPAEAAPAHAADWRALIQALEHFHSAWRKLGPLEHTIPKQALDALQTRLSSTLAALEAPLHSARQTARQQRLHLIKQARQLQTSANDRDLVTRVRALQTEWQSHAQALPLTRKDEQTLWTEFKATTDALFQERTRARQAHDSARAAEEATRTALLDQMAALSGNAPHESNESYDPHKQPTPKTLALEIARLEQQWRANRSSTKNRDDPLDTAFRAARQEALQHVEQRHQQLWQSACTALLASLQHCEQAENHADHAHTAAEQITTLPAPIPTLWRKALQERCTTRASDDLTLDTTLLRLESVLELATPPEFQAARRALKLQDMKRALESHAPVAADHIHDLMATALRLSASHPHQSARLHHILNHLPHDSLASPV